MKYNTARDHLVLPEYGRNVQKMVDHATTIQNKEERNKCVKTVSYTHLTLPTIVGV